MRLGVTTVAIFAGAFRSWHGAIHLVEAIKTLRARGEKEIGAVLVGDGSELPRVRQAAEGIDTIVFTGALPHDRMPAALAAADIGVAPFDIGRARAAVARVLLVAAEDLRVHGGGPAGRRARGGSDSRRWSRTAAKGFSTAEPESLADTLVER